VSARGVAVPEPLLDAPARRLGRPRFVGCLYNVPLRQLISRQFSHWMFRRPLNILLEQAVHPFLVVAFAGGGQNRHEGLRKRAFREHPPQQVGQAKSHEKGIGERRGAKDRGGEVLPDEASDP
jgi:hypothetical protein